MPYVPTLDAITVDKMLRGRTGPLLMQCAPISSDELTSYVVKLYGDVELEHRALARELFGALLGQVLGLTVPAMAVINVHEGLREGINDSVVKEKIRRSPGFNFGSKQVAGLPIFRYLQESQLQRGAEVFAFDMLIQNPDRRKGNPNMFQGSEDLVLFDHEMAFSYASPVMMVGGVPKPGVLERRDPVIKNHVLYNSLKGKSVRFDAFTARLQDLSGDVMDAIVDRLPKEWHTEELDSIRSYLLQVRDAAPRFKRSLQEVLA